MICNATKCLEIFSFDTTAFFSRKKYFSDSDLFPTLKVNIKEWIQVKNDEIENYAPELDTSCAFNTKQVKGVVVSKTETTWNNLNLFESSKNESGLFID